MRIQAKPSADTHLEESFGAGAGVLPANGNTGETQARMAKTDWSIYNESNAY